MTASARRLAGKNSVWVRFLRAHWDPRGCPERAPSGRPENQARVTWAVDQVRRLAAAYREQQAQGA